jgi:hypothetical protein
MLQARAPLWQVGQRRLQPPRKTTQQGWPGQSHRLRGVNPRTWFQAMLSLIPGGLPLQVAFAAASAQARPKATAHKWRPDCNRSFLYRRCTAFGHRHKLFSDFLTDYCQ